MATFAELVADVKTFTNRPDLVNETELAVKAATLKAHQSDFYPKDLYETGISWSPVAYTQSLDYRTLIPRWRALKYLRKYDNDEGAAGRFFTVLTPEQVLDDYGIEREDICYLAGEQLEIKSSTEDAYMLLGCYINPNLTSAAFISWIAVEHPYAIVYEAVRSIFKMIGYDEQAAALKQEISEQYALLKNGNILASGH
jgi:hypothetical protein